MICLRLSFVYFMFISRATEIILCPMVSFQKHEFCKSSDITYQCETPGDQAIKIGLTKEITLQQSTSSVCFEKPYILKLVIDTDTFQGTVIQRFTFATSGVSQLCSRCMSVGLKGYTHISLSWNWCLEEVFPTRIFHGVPLPHQSVDISTGGVLPISSLDQSHFLLIFKLSVILQKFPASYHLHECLHQPLVYSFISVFSRFTE